MKLCARLCVLLLVAIAGPAAATIHYVDVGGGGDYENIWGAVSAAVTGDTILVAPGTYTGVYNRRVDPSGKNLAFIADATTRAPVIIDCEHEDQAFYMNNGEDATTIIRGFTIINGENSGTGGAITCSGNPGPSPTIEDCIFLNNRSGAGGGAISIYYSSATVTNCVFRGNTAQYRGGAIYSWDSTITFSGCLFDENVIETGGEGGGALYLAHGDDVVEYCTVTENDQDQIVLVGDDSGALITNCIIASSPSGLSVGVDELGTGLVTRCVIWNNAGGDTPDCSELDNIYHNPLFCDMDADDYTLCDDSFAVHYNNFWNEQIGAFGAGCPACDTAVEPMSWGCLKALYR